MYDLVAKPWWLDEGSNPEIQDVKLNGKNMLKQCPLQEGEQ